jgi:hypothetical protein
MSKLYFSTECYLYYKSLQILQLYDKNIKLFQMCFKKADNFERSNTLLSDSLTLKKFSLMRRLQLKKNVLRNLTADLDLPNFDAMKQKKF